MIAKVKTTKKINSDKKYGDARNICDKDSVTMKKTTFKISKMDCPSEERIIRMKLEGDSSIKRLDFNIPERTMTAIHDSNPESILEKLAPLNFGSTLLETFNHTGSDIIPGDADESRVLWILFAINAAMFVVELLTGLFAESMGLVSDSFDMLADASVYLISLYAVGKSLQLKKRSAKINGYFQMVIGVGVLIETVRRFIFGSDPEPSYMIIVSIVALAANVYCLYLLSGKKEKGVHMKASYICSSNDVIANAGVIAAGILVLVVKSNIPDLVIGVLVAIVVMKGALSILSISK